MGTVASLPRDNFRREREFRDRSAAEFNQLYWKIVRKYPLPGKGADGCVEIEGNEFLKETSSKKTFHCTNCGQVIITTSEDRTKRARISCPRCKETYKLHPPYVTRKGETIQYEE